MNTQDELPSEIYAEVIRISEAGSQAFDKRDFETALGLYNRAWELLPDPRNKWNAALWLTAAQADCYYYLARFKDARIRLQEALMLPGGIGNTFVHLRLGEVDFELGNLDSAADHLVRAYALGGYELLAREHPRYITFLRSRALINDA